MNKERIKEIILVNQDFTAKVPVVKRNLNINSLSCNLLTGSRRVGKSFIIYELIQDLLKQGHSKEEILYFDFEDNRTDPVTKADLSQILECYNQLFEYRPFIFFDEIQNVEGWEDYLNFLSASRYTVCAAVSCVQENNCPSYNKHLILPFSFTEYLTKKNISFSPTDLIRNKNQIIREFDQYFTYGGLPELIESDPNKKNLLLSSVYNSIFLKEMIYNYKIRNEIAVKITLKRVAENIGSYTSCSGVVSSIQDYGMKVKNETIADYLKNAVETGFIFPVQNLVSVMEQKGCINRYFFNDNGILNSFLTENSQSLLINLVAIELQRKNIPFYFYKTQSCQIDFVLTEEKKAIQVCYSLEETNEKRKILGAFKNLPKELGIEKFEVITKGQEENLYYDGRYIALIPAWKWILG